MIKILGLGPGAVESLTIGTLEVLKNSEHVFVRTEKHPTVDYLKALGVIFNTYDNEYETGDSFDEVYSSIANDLIEQHQKYGDVVYVVPGHPLVAEKSVSILLELCRKENISYRIYPAVSFVDAMMESLKLDPIEGLKIVDAFDLKNQIQDRRSGTIITQVYNRLIASEVKLWLLDYYDDDTEIYFVRAAGIKEMESIRKIHVFELDRQEDIDYLTSIYIPKNNQNKDFNDLIEIMNVLRGENGCPWDREQSHETLKRYLIEECYEVLEAIDEKDPDMMTEELGDVLLQVVFHSRLGAEEGYFNINDVIRGICNKMIERHPHVFGNVTANTSGEVLDNWDNIKKAEKGFNSYTEEMKHVAKNLPALMRAEKIQKKASKVGFDWDKVEGAIDKVLEEIDEVKDVYKGNNRAKILDEIGDLFFAAVNVSRFLDIEPEYALNCSIEKFIKRFEYIEKNAISRGRNLHNMSLSEMDELWNRAKNEYI